MVDFLTLTANSNVSRLDIFDFSDFFDSQTDVPPKINDLRNPEFGLWFALSLSKGKRPGSRASRPTFTGEIILASGCLR
jgi:hypothetical protein